MQQKPIRTVNKNNLMNWMIDSQYAIHDQDFGNMGWILVNNEGVLDFTGRYEYLKIALCVLFENIYVPVAYCKFT